MVVSDECSCQSSGRPNCQKWKPKSSPVGREPPDERGPEEGLLLAVRQAAAQYGGHVGEPQREGGGHKEACERLCHVLRPDGEA